MSLYFHNLETFPFFYKNSFFQWQIGRPHAIFLLKGLQQDLHQVFLLSSLMFSGVPSWNKKMPKLNGTHKWESPFLEESLAVQNCNLPPSSKPFFDSVFRFSEPETHFFFITPKREQIFRFENGFDFGKSPVLFGWVLWINSVWKAAFGIKRRWNYKVMALILWVLTSPKGTFQI